MSKLQKFGTFEVLIQVILIVPRPEHTLTRARCNVNHPEDILKIRYVAVVPIWYSCLFGFSCISDDGDNIFPILRRATYLALFSINMLKFVYNLKKIFKPNSTYV